MLTPSASKEEYSIDNFNKKDSITSYEPSPFGILLSFVFEYDKKYYFFPF